MARGDLGHSDRAKEYAMDWALALVGLSGAGAVGSAVSGGAAVGNAATSASARTGSTIGAATGLTGGAFTGGLAATNVAAVYQAAQAATAAANTATAAANAQTALQQAIGADLYFDGAILAAKGGPVDGATLIQAGLAEQARTAAQTTADQTAAAAQTAQDEANAAAAKAKNSKWVTPILDICNVMHMSLNLLNGFNAPNKGDSLGGAADKLALAAKDLELAANTSGWEGSDGEPTYTASNKAQLARVKSMAGIDKAFKDVLTTQADQVLDLREVFGYVTGSFAIFKALYGGLTAAGIDTTYAQGVTGAALLGTDAFYQKKHHQNALANKATILGYAADYRNL
jgi:hypothetical protein